MHSKDALFFAFIAVPLSRVQGQPLGPSEADGTLVYSHQSAPITVLAYPSLTATLPPTPLAPSHIVTEEPVENQQFVASAPFDLTQHSAINFVDAAHPGPEPTGNVPSHHIDTAAPAIMGIYDSQPIEQLPVYVTTPAPFVFLAPQSVAGIPSFEIPLQHAPMEIETTPAPIANSLTPAALPNPPLVQSGSVNAVLTQVTAGAVSVPMAARSSDAPPPADLATQTTPRPPPPENLIQRRRRGTPTVPPPEPEHEIVYEDDLWGEDLVEEILKDDFEERLNRLEALKHFNGHFPVEYFDEPPESKPPVKFEYRSRHSPVYISDDELLAQEPLDLSPYRAPPNETLIYCYPFSPDEIMSKCHVGLETLKATGLLIPMTSELQTERDPIYYKNLATLTNTMRRDGGGRYKIYGVAYDNPNWALITQVVMKYPLFDGVVIEWIGRDACPWNILPPTVGQVETILDRAGPIMYYYRLQNCDEDLVLNSELGPAFVNPNDSINTTDVTVEKGKFPKFMKPIFPCHGGEEARCHKGLRFHRDKACNSDLQYYSLSPYEALGQLFAHFINETCNGLPSHLMYSVV